MCVKICAEETVSFHKIPQINEWSKKEIIYLFENLMIILMCVCMCVFAAELFRTELDDVKTDDIVEFLSSLHEGEPFVGEQFFFCSAIYFAMFWW